MVIRVDKDKGYIDLSKRRVSPEEVVKTEERFNKAKAVHSILRHVSNRMREPIGSLYERVGWPLTRRYGHAFDAFQLSVSEPENVCRDVAFASPEERRELLEHVRVKMMPQPLKIRADIQVTCFGYEGIEAIRAALLAGQALSTDAVPIRIQLIAPPLYVMFTTTLNKDAGIEALTNAIGVVKATIEGRGGSLAVKMAPTATTAADDNDLDRMMDDLAGEGDDEDDEGGDGEDETMGAGDFATGELDLNAGLPDVPLARGGGGGGGGGGAGRGGRGGGDDEGDEEDEGAPAGGAAPAAPAVVRPSGADVPADDHAAGGTGEYVAEVGTSLVGRKKKKATAKKGGDDE